MQVYTKMPFFHFTPVGSVGISSATWGEHVCVRKCSAVLSFYRAAKQISHWLWQIVLHSGDDFETICSQKLQLMKQSLKSAEILIHEQNGKQKVGGAAEFRVYSLYRKTQTWLLITFADWGYFSFSMMHWSKYMFSLQTDEIMRLRLEIWHAADTTDSS